MLDSNLFKGLESSLGHLLLKNWNFFIKNDFPTVLELIRVAIVLRRYENANLLLITIGDQYNKIPDSLMELLYIRLDVIREIEQISGVSIIPEKYNLFSLDGPKNIQSSEFLSKKINEYGALDCVVTKGFLDTCFSLAYFDLKENDISKNTEFTFFLDYTWFDSIGHFYYVDSLLKGMILKIVPIKKVYFLIQDNSIISNKYLYDTYITLFSQNDFYDFNPNFENNIYLNIRLWPKNDGKIAESTSTSAIIQNAWFESGRTSFDLISQKDTVTFKQSLEEMIRIGDKKIITLHIRQSSFKRENKFSFGGDARNAEPLTFFKAIRDIGCNDFHFVMLGDAGMKKVPKEFSDIIFDYAHSPLKSEKFDAFLIQYTAGHIGTLSGISHLPCVFGKLTLITNAFPLIPVISTHTFYLPKTLLFKDNPYALNRFYHEIKPTVYWGGKQAFRNLDIQLLDNSYDDLKLGIQTLLDKLSGRLTNDYFMNKSFEDTDIKTESNIVPIEINFYRKYS